MTQLNTEDSTKHGSPMDRGSADAWYGRRPEPHWWPEGTYHGEKVTEEDMSSDEIKAYWLGFDNEDDRKDWG